MEPAFAGFVIELTVPSRLTAAAWPIPDGSCVRIAGAVALTGTVMATAGVRTPCCWTPITVCALPATSFGAIAVICPGAARISGAATPSKKTCQPPSTVASLPSEPSWGGVTALGPMEPPKMVTTPAGARG